MGSDLYTVSVRTYREHTTEEARARLAAYGHGPAAAGFFSGEGPWIEIRLDVRSIHPDAPIGWDPLFVIRWLDEAVYRSAPGGVRHVATGPDGALWCIGMRGYLARLKKGDVPRVYVWDGPPTGLWDDVAEIAVAPEGDVWLRLGGGVIAGVRASDLAAADAAPPVNADMPHLARVGPAAFGAAAAPGGAQAIDFKGKTVVITGTLSKLTRAEAQRVLADRGAVLSDSVNKKTDYLIAGLKPSSKLKKAESLGIPVLDEDVLLSPG